MNAVIAFYIEHQAQIATIAFALSEILGAIPQVKSNGFLSLGIILARKLKK